MSSPKEQAHAFLLGRINYERSPAATYGAKTFKLDRMRQLLQRLGDPQRGLPIVHIAGSKGKGSTAAMVAAVLAAAGYRTGLYHSPHLDRIEERFVVDGQACTDEEFVELVECVRPVAEEMDARGDVDGQPMGPTFFELTTAMALLHFAGRAVDAAVLEVGLGGRLDSTNVCQPRVAGITNISFDHTQQLGNTLERIAREKAGIIKLGVPVVSGVLDPEPRAVIEQTCQAQGCRLSQLSVDFDFAYRPPCDVQQQRCYGQMDFLLGDERDTSRDSELPIRYESLELNLLGRHQAANAAVALAAVAELQRQGWTVAEDAVRRGLAGVRWPARVDVIQRQPTLVLDAAHNLASIQALVETLAESFSAGRRILVFGTTGDKDVRAMLAALLPHFDHAVLTQYVKNPRGVPPAELDAMARAFPISRTVCRDPAEAWQAASAMARPEDLVCITGSFFLAAEMRAEMGQTSGHVHSPVARG